jgi:hypothetical protein
MWERHLAAKTRYFGKLIAAGCRSHNFKASIADFTELKEWYKKLDFREGETKTFAHLPFRVLLMSYRLS